jgi:hypothetical protein
MEVPDMRKLMFALTAAAAIACAVPANAQTYHYATPFGLTTGFAPWSFPAYYGAAWNGPVVRYYAAVPRIGVRRVVRRANVLGAYAYAPFVGVGFGPAYWVYE